MPNGKNRAIRTKKIEGKLVNENVKIVSKVKKGQKAFIGGSYLYAVAEGDGISQTKEDKTLLLLSDLSGHMLLPFLSPYYEKIYIINTINMEYSSEEFKNIFREYEISDLVIVHQGQNAGNLSKNIFFKGILNLDK